MSALTSGVLSMTPNMAEPVLLHTGAAEGGSAEAVLGVVHLESPRIVDRLIDYGTKQ
jgi:hypothetical protein